MATQWVNISKSAFYGDVAGYIRYAKNKSSEKIDGAVATIMALDRAIRCSNTTGKINAACSSYDAAKIVEYKKLLQSIAYT